MSMNSNSENRFDQLGSRAMAWAARINPFTDVYGLARTLLAVSTMLTLLFNPTTTLFHPASGIPGGPICMEGTIASQGLFCLSSNLELLRWLAILGLGVVASGWRPRVTGPLHWWISASLSWGSLLADGGEQVAMILTLLLVPVTLLDDRRWHWERAKPSGPDESVLAKRFLALVFLTLIRIQMAVIYFHAAAGKFAVPEWTDGTVLYYWFSHPTFGLAGIRQELLWPLMTSPTIVALTTWGVLVVEALLFAGLVADRRHWRVFLISGLTLHAGIAVLHGLLSFSLIMAGGLVLFYHPVDASFGFMTRWKGKRS